MTVGWRVSKRDRAFTLLVARGQLSRLLTFLSVCWNSELTSRWLFPLLPREYRSLCFLLHVNFPKCCPQPIQKSKHLFPRDSTESIPELAPLNLSHSLTNSQCTFFQNNLHPSPHHLMYKEVLDHQNWAAESLHFPLRLQMVVSTSCLRTWSSSSCQQ